MTKTDSVESRFNSKWNNAKAYIDLDQIMDDLGIVVDHVSGKEHVALCPLHVDSNPSFSINSEKLVYNCFACGGGSLPELVSKIRDISLEDAIDYLVKSTSAYDEDPTMFATRLKKILATTVVREEIEYPEYNEAVLEPFIRAFAQSEEAQNYVIERGINLKVAEQFKIGYDGSAFRVKRGFDSYTGPAIILPHFFKGSLVGYQQRWLDEDRPKWVPKYTNTGAFPKYATVWNYDQAIESDVMTIVVESVFTALYLESEGYTAVATFGAEVADQQIRVLSNFGSGVALSFDNDDPGHRARELVGKALRNSVPVYYVEYVPGHKSDLNNLGPNELEAYLADKDKVYPAFLHNMR